jgi:hypothetical protein
MTNNKVHDAINDHYYVEYELNDITMIIILGH